MIRLMLLNIVYCWWKTTLIFWKWSTPVWKNITMY